MLSVICFSKDRPLQLQAYLESLIFFSGLKEPYITVLFKETGSIKYDELLKKFSHVNWIREENFNNDLSCIVKNSENFILFGCDDVFFKSQFNPNYCIKALQADSKLYAFSLRMGANITGLPQLKISNHHLEWDWSETVNPNWNYPWEVSGSIYRKIDVLNYMNYAGEFSNPNYFEDLFHKKLLSDKKMQPGISLQRKLACFNNSKCLTLTINRVQDEFNNEFDGSLPTDIDSLYKAYTNGQRISWESFEECQNNVVHVTSKFFRLTSDSRPGNRDLIETGQDFGTDIPVISWKTKQKILFYRFFIPFKEQIRPFIPRTIIQWMRGLVR